MAKKNKLDKDLETTQNRQVAAVKLTELLKSEGVRWKV